MPRLRASLLSLLLASSLSGGTVVPPAPDRKAPEKSDWVFSILPKSLQKNPNLELTVITEMTEAGKKLPPVSPEQPAYFQLHANGLKDYGDASGIKRTFKPEEIERLLLRSLGTNGYLPAKMPEQSPSLLIFYTWGSHNTLSEPDEENGSLSASAVAANILDRAALVGGDKFAKKLIDLFAQADSLNLAANAQLAPGGEPPIPASLVAFANPVNLFKLADPKNEFLLDQSSVDLFYVVASAYDYRALAANKRVLLWRTRMTVASQGVSQEQTFPTLVLSAAPFFGKDMPGPEIIQKRALRENVEIGTPTVIESVVPARPSTKK